MDARDRFPEHDLDTVVAVERLVLDVRNGGGFAAQELLRQRRAVVGERRLVREESDVTASTGFAVGPDRARRGQTAAGDRELEPLHRFLLVGQGGRCPSSSECRERSRPYPT
jgi:hypothetical protein